MTTATACPGSRLDAFMDQLTSGSVGPDWRQVGKVRQLAPLRADGERYKVHICHEINASQAWAKHGRA